MILSGTVRRGPPSLVAVAVSAHCALRAQDGRDAGPGAIQGKRGAEGVSMKSPAGALTSRMSPTSSRR
jgi:hypothetical protein